MVALLVEHQDLLTVTGVGLRFDRPPSLSEWVALSDYVGKVAKLTPWMIGDLINAAEDFLGEEWTQYVSDDEAECIFGVSGKTALNYSYITRKMPLSRRREGLSLSFCAEIVNRIEDPADQDEWLDRAVANGWNSKTLRLELNDQEPESGLLDAALFRLERAVAYGREVLDGEELDEFNKRLGKLAWTKG